MNLLFKFAVLRCDGEMFAHLFDGRNLFVGEVLFETSIDFELTCLNDEWTGFEANVLDNGQT